MGRDPVPNSDKFKRVYPTPNKKRWKVQCKFCLAAGAVTLETFTGRPENYEKHLSKCPHYQAHLAANESAITTPAVQNPCDWTPAQVAQMKNLLVSYQHLHRLPDSFIECEITRRWYEFLCPGIRQFLPSRKLLGGSMLRDQARLSEATTEAELKLMCKVHSGRVNLVSDVWQNVAKDHLLGSQLVLFGSVMTYQLTAVGHRHDGVAIAKDLDGLIKTAIEDHWTIGSGITDDAGQCGRARRILALRWPKMVFLRCFAHDINNLVKQVLKLDEFRKIAREAAALVNAINASSSKWLFMLREIMVRKYKKIRALLTLCETRWSSMQACFASVLRARQALTLFVCEFGSLVGFPAPVLQLQRSGFWDELAKAEQVIRPLSVASYRLQRDENTLADVVVSYREIYREFAGNPLMSAALVSCVEKRWANCEQPLFMLALFLHPIHVHDAALLPATAVSSTINIKHFAIYYYRRFFDDDYGQIREQMGKWLAGKYTHVAPGDFEVRRVASFWKEVREERPNDALPKLALAVLSIVVNTATRERLFSELGNVHTPIRNRMSSAKSRRIQIVREHARRVLAGSSSDVVLKKKNRFVSPNEDDDVADEDVESSSLELFAALTDNPEAIEAVATESDSEVNEATQDASETMEFWTSYLSEIDFENFDLERADPDSDDPVNPRESISEPDTTPFPDQAVAVAPEEDIDPDVPIPDRDETPFPAHPTPHFPQESKLTGIRALSATLACIFR